MFIYSSGLSTVTWAWPWTWLREPTDPHFGNACFHQTENIPASTAPPLQSILVRLLRDRIPPYRS